MSLVKESLLSALESLDEEKIQKTLQFVQNLNKKSEESRTLERLRKDPAFKVPQDPFQRLPKVKPAKIKGIPASKLLIGDRR